MVVFVIERIATQTIEQLLASYPVVTITGPRQSGKTTLARLARPDLPYVNLEDLRNREFAQNDPIKFMETYAEGAVLDEIQRVPHLASQVQVAVDRVKHKGMYILTGSHQFEVMERVTQSLAGRSAVFRLLPLSVGEVLKASMRPSTDELLLGGLYPQVIAEGLDPTAYYQDYVATYVERDVRQLSEIRNLESFRLFLKVAAGRIGSMLDLAALGDAVGVSQPTARSWMTLLQASYLVFLLPPYFANIRKRLVKRPKLYFCDVGLAALLLDMTDVRLISVSPQRGALFENLAVLEVIKARYNAHLPLNSYFYRDQRNEVDLILSDGPRVRAVEIKSGKTVNSDYFKGISALSNTSLDLLEPSWVVYDGEQTQRRSQATVMGLPDFASEMAANLQTRKPHGRL